MLQERRKEKEKRVYRNGLFYHPDKPNIVVGGAFYGITNTRFSTTPHYEAIVSIKK